MKKVNLDVIKPWISNRITELLGIEDELVIDYAGSLLEEEVIHNPSQTPHVLSLTLFYNRNLIQSECRSI
jgi:hypothetical protein